METTTTRVALKWGLINGIIAIVIATLIYVFDLWKYGWSGFIGIVPLAILMYLAHNEFKAGNEGFMNYGQGLGIGVLIGAISGIISSIYGLVYTQFIDSNIMESIKDFQVEKMEEQGLSDQQIEGALDVMSKFQSPGFTFLAGIFMSILGAFVIALIISAITQKKKPVFM
ncbi:Protein of unknown function [Spirosomataceae bacterium TFI 002]|nr:Protein of unknown function [Spirosomataceae bacterium TFI 002]